MNIKVEDIYLGAKSYQRKLNLTKPQRTCQHISIKEPYTPNYDLPGIIYEDMSKKKRLMRVDEIHKFYDGTLQSVHKILRERLLNFKFGYNKDMSLRGWTAKDNKCTSIMLNKIDGLLFKRQKVVKISIGALVNVKLTGCENYRVWATAMKIALQAKNKMGFVDGTCVKSTYDTSVPLSNQWERCNVVVLSWLLRKHQQLMKLMQFLMGLDDVYQPIRSSLLTQPELPDVKDAFVIVCREESHRGLGTQYDSLSFKNYGMKGHTIDRCFEIIGYPNGFKKNSNGNFRNNNNKEFSNSNNKGGSSNNVEKKDNSGVQANMAGANQHITNSTKIMTNVVDISELNNTVGHPNGTITKINHVGNLKLTNNVVLFDVLVIPEYTVSLLSVNKMIKDSKLHVGFNEHGCIIQDLKKENVLGTGSESGGLYMFDIDYDFSRAVWVYLIKSKDEVFGYFVDFVNLISNQFLKRVKVIRSDNGTEFINNKMDVFLRDKGIVHQTSCAYTPQQNGIAERKATYFFFKVLESFISRRHQNISSPNDDEEGSSGDAREVIVDHQSTDTAEEQPFNDDVHTASSMDDNPISEGNVPFKYDLNKYANHTKLSANNSCFISNLNKTDEPTCYNEAVKDINWVQAMNNEMEALYLNNTWTLTELPINRKAIGSKWVYKIKYKSDGEVERYKVRVVAKGFRQKEWVDNGETFSHVVKISTAPRQWNKKLVETLTEAGFLQRNNNAEISKFKAFQNQKFKIKDLGELKIFLGIEVLKIKNGLCLNQRKYCIELLHEYGLLACKPVATPMPENGILSHKETENDKLLKNITSYQKIVGKLIYLCNTRPDIAYYVHCLSQHMHSPIQSHFEAALRVLRYLKSAPGAGIIYTKSSTSSIRAYADYDWAKCKMTRRSVSRYWVFVCGGFVSWKSKKQATLLRSSAEAEYRSMTYAVCEVMWIVKILKDLNFSSNIYL
ncbi:ribonuclease H-like domain-containing protein [Tanacetum coccineum]|uniref:Ribonuclease H-like domain-containing protein n=1 Tax=Tanacetum coccineum TaxID=301880 RepID=A0ABQ5HD06_9ASTR